MEDICCIGNITRDRVITPRGQVDMAGGTAYYFAKALNQLPPVVTTLLVTKVGEESMDEVEAMRRAGINMVCHRCPQSVYFENIYGDDPNYRQQRVLAKAAPFTTEELQQIEARYYHLGPLLADDFAPETIERLAEKGKVSIDVQGFLRRVDNEQVLATDWADKKRVLSVTDVVKVNEHEMEVVTRCKDARRAAMMIADYGVREVVVTLGSHGSLIYAEGKFYDIPAFAPREVVDATGCGDTYSAGYLYCRAQGMGYEEAGRMAAALCTLKLAHAGPFDRSMAEIVSLIHNSL